MNYVQSAQKQTNFQERCVRST